MLVTFTHLKHCTIKVHLQRWNLSLTGVTHTCDQAVNDGKGSTPLDPGSSYDANVQNASEEPS